jgi:hypothetical protein
LSSLAFSSSSSNGSGSGPYSAKGPGQQLKSWESGAKLVKNTTVENKYLDHIRDVHDPSQHLKTIEDELKGTIGQALGKQGQKILLYARLMEQERNKYEDLVSTNHLENENDSELLQESAIAHNNYRKECIQARWELMVHRQAAGFIVGNHQFVREKYPIGDALPVAEKHDDKSNNDKQQKQNHKPKQFTDQLDWWASVGRWK